MQTEALRCYSCGKPLHANDSSWFWLGATAQCGHCYTLDLVARRKSPFEKPQPVQPAQSTQVGGNHYKDFAIQPAEFITRNKLGFLEGCVIKRMCRHGAKAKREDLEKAKHEIDLLIAFHYPEA